MAGAETGLDPKGVLYNDNGKMNPDWQDPSMCARASRVCLESVFLCACIYVCASCCDCLCEKELCLCVCVCVHVYMCAGKELCVYV